MPDRKDYVWDETSPAKSSVIDEDALPQRFALTAPQVLIQKHTDRMLLIDPHPEGTWETWMFPYASLVLTSEQVRDECANTSKPEPDILGLESPVTLAELSLALRDLRDTLDVEYRDAISRGVNNVLPALEGSWDAGNAIYENYSLKFSGTSNTYTAYDFNYYLTYTDIGSVQVPHVWVERNELQRLVRSGDRYKGRLVSSNVIDALDFLVTI